MSYLDETVPADTEAVTLGAGRIRSLKQQLDALIEQIFEDAGTFLPGWITANGATGSTSMFALGAIQSADIGAGQVGTSNLAALSVTNAKLALGSVAAVNLASGIVMPTASVSTGSIQPGALSATTQGRALVANGFITAVMMGFPVVQAYVGTYAGSNSASAVVTGLPFTPDVLILTAGTDHGIGMSFLSEASGGISSIHASWVNTAIVSPNDTAVQWTSSGFTILPTNFQFNATGRTMTFIALDI